MRIEFFVPKEYGSNHAMPQFLKWRIWGVVHLIRVERTNEIDNY